MAVKTSFPKGVILEMLLHVNCFAADKGKSLICRAFIEAEMILNCVYAGFYIILLKIFSNDFYKVL